MADILPDILAPGLKLVVCGSAAGTRSAELGAYYAGPGHRFWGMLHQVGLTPTVLAPADFRGVLAYGIGLTDIVKTAFGPDSGLKPTDFDREGLRRRIETFQPRILAFNGKRSASAFFGIPVAYGYQSSRDIGATRVYVAPSTSGAARGFWDEGYWRLVAEAARA
ncbi:MAG TPA: mismatch-specific DNA-glycosylase [Alphaproteobacteria bacterium]|nr:mismatch-specific DNA-glycosylase [Alphaproteobacteria bacterium]